MKRIRTFLIVVGILLLIGICACVYVWYMIQQLHVKQDVLIAPSKDESTVDTSHNYKDPVPIPSVTPTSPPQQPQNISTGTKSTIQIRAADLSDAQRDLIRTLGLPETFVITESMIQCAKTGVGEARLAEIIKGAAPSPMEAVRLGVCLKK